MIDNVETIKHLLELELDGKFGPAVVSCKPSDIYLMLLLYICIPSFVRSVIIKHIQITMTAGGWFFFLLEGDDLLLTSL